MTGIGFWNNWVNGLYYLSEREGSRYFTIQVVLNKINENLQFLSQNAASLGSMSTANIPTTTARMAIAVIGIAPILIAYPFFQKYFIKGIMIGGVKE
jgi:putative aldouronate transport system permease protein